MLVRDIKPPIREVIDNVTEKAVRSYRKAKLLIKTSKYAVPIIALALILLITSITIAIQDEREAVFYPVIVISNGWDGAGNVRIAELDETANIEEFNNQNSTYVYFSNPIEEPGEGFDEVEISTSTEETQPAEPSDTELSTSTNPIGESQGQETETSTSTEETQSAEPATSTDVIDGTDTPDESTSTEPIILPLEEPPIIEPEATTTDGPTTYFLDLLRSRFTTRAQEDLPAGEAKPTPPPPDPPVPSEAEGEPLTEELSPEEPATPGEEHPTLATSTPTTTESIETPTSTTIDTIISGSDTDPDVLPGEIPPKEKGEEAENAEDVLVFFDRKELSVSSFEPSGDVILYDENYIRDLQINFSLAMDGNKGENDLLLLEYRLRETEEWNRLEALTQDREHSNKANGGYFSYEIPLEASTILLDIKDIEVRAAHFSDNKIEDRLPVFIDAIWIDITYLDNVTEDAVFAELVSDNDTFGPDEIPELSFKYRDPRGIVSRASNQIVRGNDEFRLKSHGIVQRGLEKIDEADNTGTVVTYESDKNWTMKIADTDSSIKPGKYIMELQMERGEKIYKQKVEFFWGVLAINTTKSIYLPGEVAEFRMAALTDTGNTICDANLRLIIRAPDGSETKLQVDRSASCGPNNVTTKPDYRSSYLTMATGTYRMRLERLDETGELVHFITDSFEVRESVPFDVERNGPTRIWPLANYTMPIFINPSEDYNGTITETVPASFEIIASSHPYSETTQGDTKTIEWNLTLAEGEETSITYTFDPPDITPEIHLIGPLQIGRFKEARRWQIASDALAIQNDATFAQFLNSSSPTVTLDVASGATIAVLTGMIDGGETFTGNISDTDGDTWVVAVNVSGSPSVIIAYAVNPTVNASKVINASTSASTADGFLDAYSITGSDTSDPLGATSTSNGTSGTPNTTFSTNNASSLIAWAVASVDNGTWSSPGTGQVERTNAVKGGNPKLGMYGSSEIIDTAGSNDQTVTNSKSRAWRTAAVEFNAAPPATPTAWTQSAYRWFDNADSAQVGAALAAQDASTTLGALGDEFRLRMLLHASITDSGTSTEVFKLQFATSTPGGCDTGFSGEDYIDVATSTGDIRYFDNPSTPNDGDFLTATSSDPSDSGHTTTTQTYEESNNFTVTSTVSAGNDGLWDFSLDDAGLVSNQTYCFRVVYSDDSLLADGYSVIPEISTAAGVLTVDIVDSGGSPVGSPSISLNAATLSFSFQTVTGTFGISAEKIRVNNMTANPEWSLSVAASSTTAFWDGTADYDFNDPAAGAGDGGDGDSLGGQMNVDALTSGVITPQGGCNDTGLTLGTATSFNEGVVDSITILSAGVTATTSCYWDLTTVDISQTIPAEQAADSYNIDIIVTVVAI